MIYPNCPLEKRALLFFRIKSSYLEQCYDSFLLFFELSECEEN